MDRFMWACPSNMAWVGFLPAKMEISLVKTSNITNEEWILDFLLLQKSVFWASNFQSANLHVFFFVEVLNLLLNAWQLYKGWLLLFGALKALCRSQRVITCLLLMLARVPWAWNSNAVARVGCSLLFVSIVLFVPFASVDLLTNFKPPW